MNENKKYIKFDETFRRLNNCNILLQTYITTFGVNYFLCKVILKCA